jgi:nicotinamidase-related amidase
MLSLDAKKTALLVMDFQADVLARFGEKMAAAIERTATLLMAARGVKLPVVYVCVGFRPGYPELNPRNATFAAVASTGRFVVTTPGADIVPALKPEPGDVVVIKHRVSAFAATDLDLVLRAKGVEALILTGIATSGVVLSTLRHAADADYQLYVAKDCCADMDDEVHRVLTEKVFIRQSTVANASELGAALTA